MRFFTGFCLIAFAFLSFGLCGCSAGGEVVCTASVDPSLVVYVNDAATGLPAAANATVTVTDGSYTATLPASLSNLAPDGSEIPTGFSGPYERAGTYTVRVVRPGYADAERTGIRVTKGKCHVSTQTLTIALTPLATQ